MILNEKLKHLTRRYRTTTQNSTLKCITFIPDILSLTENVECASFYQPKKGLSGQDTGSTDIKTNN